MNISLITATFNSAATLRDTIQSVINQTFHDIEYIIVDGGSTDKTVPGRGPAGRDHGSRGSRHYAGDEQGTDRADGESVRSYFAGKIQENHGPLREQQRSTF